MASLLVREVDKALMKKLKHEAIDAGMTLREYVIALLSSAVNGKRAK